MSPPYGARLVLTIYNPEGKDIGHLEAKMDSLASAHIVMNVASALSMANLRSYSAGMQEGYAEARRVADSIRAGEVELEDKVSRGMPVFTLDEVLEQAAAENPDG